jgi:hypothetical protein
MTPRSSLVGWTDEELRKRFAEWPEDETWKPYDVEEGYHRLERLASASSREDKVG